MAADTKEGEIARVFKLMKHWSRRHFVVVGLLLSTSLVALLSAENILELVEYGSLVNHVAETTAGHSSLLFAKMPINGRLGNELFMYATMFCIGRKMNRTIVLERGRRLYRYFNISSYPVPLSMHLRFELKTKTEKFCCKHDESIAHFVNDTKGPVQLIGYLQSYKYFESCLTDIKREFTFSSHVTHEINDYLTKLTTNKNRTLFIGVHIRRGDMMRKENHAFGYTVAPRSYLDLGVYFYKQLFPQHNLVFVVVSDDVTWSKKNFRGHGCQVAFPDFVRPAIFDLAFLSACNHSLITTGTFGWWGAYLAGGKVVYYRNYPAPLSGLAKRFKKRDYYPPHWVGLK